MSSGEINKKIVTVTEEKITAEGLKNSNANLLPVNSVMLAMNGQGKTKGMTAILKIESTCNQSLAAFICDEKKLYYRYLFYFFDNKYKELRGLVGDDLREGLSLSVLRNIKIPLPAYLEQVTISNFLDNETSKLQQLIDFKQHQIELLHEHEKSLIHKAVTKGLDPNAKMKDSGVEWIGNIPGDWEINRLKRLCSEKITDGPHETPDFISEGIPFLSVDSIQNGMLIFDECRHISKEAHELYKQKSNPKKGDVLLGKAASVGKVAIVDVDFEFNIWSPLALIRTNEQRLLPKYLEFYLKSDIMQDQISILSSENTQKNIGMNKIERFLLTVPPINQQTKIVEMLIMETSKIHQAINTIETQIVQLEEYRKSLIYDVVTGKVKVS